LRVKQPGTIDTRELLRQLTVLGAGELPHQLTSKSVNPH